MHNMKCFKCEKTLKSSDPNDLYLGQPSNGTYWRACGNYGSTIWDPMSETHSLECYICDDCLKKNSNLIYSVIHDTPLIRNDKYFEGIRYSDDKTTWPKE